MKCRSICMLAVWLSLSCAAVPVFAASCPGTAVTVHLTSPSGPGTYKTPLRFTATASSTFAITGYAVYTDSWSNIPFATGQPMYLNAKSTLDAWVILPQNSSGGALSQNVFVRAWDAQGNCGDSATLAITASGSAIPTSFPAGYQQWLNRDRRTTFLEVWDAWDQASGHWIPAIRNTMTDNNPTGTPISCPKFSTGAWHHLQFYVQRTYPDTTYPEGRILYGTVALDGAATQWDISAPIVLAPAGYTDVLGFQHQLDINGSAPNPTTLQEWADIDNLTAWPQD